VEAPDLSPAGRASVTVPSLDVAPGESFPVRIDLELLRPLGAGRGGSAMLEIGLDCVLFQDLTAYGPDVLRTRRNLTVYELEARRDREYFRNLAASGRTIQLQEEINAASPYLHPPQLGLELLGKVEADSHVRRPVSLSFVPFSNSPVEMLRGNARIFRNEIETPQLSVRNGSKRMLQTVEIGWILRDEGGHDYMAGSLPADVAIAPAESGSIQQNGVLRFSHPSGRPMMVEQLLAFVRNVQYADGSMWIPTRADIGGATLDPSVRRAIANSPEEQRLFQIYRKKGMNALMAELLRQLN
jgi:hypothetical protein